MHYELMLAARKELAKWFGGEYDICYENVEFTPPKCGKLWLAYHYKEVESEIVSLRRTDRVFVGMVQVNVVFPPASGTDKARKLAKDIADFFEDGKMLETGYISEGGYVCPVQKSETGWMIPVRFAVRFDKKGVYNAST